MTQYVYLCPQGVPQTSPDWPCWCWDSSLPGEPARLTRLDQVGHAGPVQVILPFEMASWFLTDPWPERRRPSLQALEYALEERLAVDPQEVCLFAGRADAQRRYPVWVVQRSRFQALQAVLERCQVRPLSIRVDADLLAADRPSAVWIEGRWLLGGQLPLRLALNEEALPAVAGQLPKDLHWFNAVGSPFNPADLNLSCSTAIDWMPAASRRSRLPWRTLAASVACALVVAVGFGQARVSFIQAQTAQLQAQTLQRFQQAWPGQSIDTLVQTLAAAPRPAAAPLGRSGELAQLNDLLLSGAVIEAQRVQWQEGAGWRLELQAERLADFERLTHQGRAQGLPVTLGSATQADGRISAVMTYPGEVR
jgi:general secretion pathway protein L